MRHELHVLIIAITCTNLIRSNFNQTLQSSLLAVINKIYQQDG